MIFVNVTIMIAMLVFVFIYSDSTNVVDPVVTQKRFAEITSSTGYFTMKNSRGEECILAYAPVASTEGWTLLSYMPMADLGVNTENWHLRIKENR